MVSTILRYANMIDTMYILSCGQYGKLNVESTWPCDRKRRPGVESTKSPKAAAAKCLHGSHDDIF